MVGQILMIGRTTKRRQFGLSRGSRFVFCVGVEFGNARQDNKAGYEYAKQLQEATGFFCHFCYAKTALTPGLIPENSNLFRWCWN